LALTRSVRRTVVVLDNASVHKHPGVVAAIEGAGAIIIWTAAYSPDMNPIEKCFNQYKAYMLRNGRRRRNPWLP
jgi:transposase